MSIVAAIPPYRATLRRTPWTISSANCCSACGRSRCGEIFARCGLTAAASDSEGSVDHWQDPLTGSHIELHTELFSSGWPAEETLNPYFSDPWGRTPPDRSDSRPLN